MKTQHTRGPWILGPETCADGRRVLAGANGELTVGWSVGYAPKPGSNERPLTLVEAKANAALFAAALDLLAACERAVYLVGCINDASTMRNIRPDLDEISDVCKAAIAKATGGAK